MLSDIVFGNNLNQRERMRFVNIVMRVYETRVILVFAQIEKTKQLSLGKYNFSTGH